MDTTTTTPHPVVSFPPHPTTTTTTPFATTTTSPSSISLADTVDDKQSLAPTDSQATLKLQPSSSTPINTNDINNNTNINSGGGNNNGGSSNGSGRSSSYSEIFYAPNDNDTPDKPKPRPTEDTTTTTSSVDNDNDDASIQLSISEQQSGCYCGCGNVWRQLLKFAGPGFMVAMAYIDPGNLAADIDQGVAAGYKLAWVTLWCSLLGFLIQMLAVKLAVATHSHLAQHCRQQYSTFPRITLWLIIELGILAVDVLEVLSGAIAMRTLTNGAVPLWAGVLITVVLGFGTLCLERWGMRMLEAAVVCMMTVMAGTFGYLFFATDVDYAAVARGLVIPQLNPSILPYAVGAIGAIIMPHNLYLHSALALIRTDAVSTYSDEMALSSSTDSTGRKERTRIVKRAVRYSAIETSISLTVALFINICIIAVFAAAFAGDGVGEVGISNAGEALAAYYSKPNLQYIWGAGLLAAAAASTVTSTYAGQVVIVGFLNLQIGVWWRALGVRLATLGPTLLIAVFVTSDDLLSELAVWLNITQSVVLPVAVVPLVVFSSMKVVMGQDHVNKIWVSVAYSFAALFLIGMNGYLAVSFALEKLPVEAYALVPFCLVMALYVLFLVYLAMAPLGLVDRAVAGMKKTTVRIRRAMPLDRAVDLMEGF